MLRQDKLGILEGAARNEHRAMKHFICSARAGDKKSLDALKLEFMDGVITKDEYANILRAYQQRHDEMKSDMRDIKPKNYRATSGVVQVIST